MLTNISKLASSTIAKNAGGSSGGGASAAELAALQARVEELARANQALQEALHAAHSGTTSMQGYLNKHRPITQLMGLFAQEWELRYFILSGTVLRYYRSERDAGLCPRGVVDVQDCLVETEDTSRSGWRFRIVEPGGNVLLRLGTDNRAAAEKWLGALEAAGLRVLPHCSTSAAAASGLSAGGARGGGGVSAGGAAGSGYPDKRLQDRWEACSTDSEMSACQADHRAPRPRVSRPPHPSAAAAAAAAAVADATTTADSRGAQQQQQQQHHHHQQQPPRRPQQAAPPPQSAAAAAAGAPAAAGADAAAASSKVQIARTAAAAAAARPPMVGSTPVHTVARYSYLSSDGVWAAKHEGLLNLGLIILVITNFRLIIENLLRYGLRYNLASYVARSLAGRGNLPLVLAFPALLMFSLAALGIECLGVTRLRREDQLKAALSKKGADSKAAAQAYQAAVRTTELLMLALNGINTSAALAAPCLVIHWTQAEAAPGLLLMLCTLTVWMKLVSYAHCHHDLRVAHRANLLRPGERGAPETNPEWATLKFPENLTARNMLFYLAVPTLTYQVNFPRSPRIRKRWLLRRFAELAVYCGLVAFLGNQYIEPAVSNAVRPLSESDWIRVVERVLKLALPNLYCWLCIFYMLFHLWLNILAELTRFGDREFYKDWWNAATVGEYWRSWNIAVHKWLLRTIYYPAMRAGVCRYWAMVLVFFVSAVGHELAVGIPLHMLRCWSFWGIMAQVPLISLTESLRKRLKSDTWGNTIFWLTFCVIGQPVSLLLYYHDYVFNNAERARQALAAGGGGDYLGDA